MKNRLLVLAVMSWAVVTVLACAPKSPEEKVAQLRSYYTAVPVGFLVKATPEEPMEAVPAPAGETPDADSENIARLEALREKLQQVSRSGSEAEPDESVMAEAEPVPVRQSVLIDILLQHDSPERLSGVTIDISMVNAAEAELAHWRIWADTAKLPKATGTQFTHVLEDVDYEEGNAFSVEVRHPIPVEERAEYREFTEAGGAD